MPLSTNFSIKTIVTTPFNITKINKKKQYMFNTSCPTLFTLIHSKHAINASNRVIVKSVEVIRQKIALDL